MFVHAKIIMIIIHTQITMIVITSFPKKIAK